tara:strand:- start:372 stop:602 length:231 start_codon:yes stop_codon:yes gene_type:complete
MKIFLLVMFISMPNAPSVRYNALLYPTEMQCIVARNDYNEAYLAKDLIYKSKIRTEAFCLPFESFPIIGLQLPTGA